MPGGGVERLLHLRGGWVDLSINRDGKLRGCGPIRSEPDESIFRRARGLRPTNFFPRWSSISEEIR
jgi:hypothetical protein